jgi:hypothetical protein
MQVAFATPSDFTCHEYELQEVEFNVLVRRIANHPEQCHDDNQNARVKSASNLGSIVLGWFLA